VGEKEKQYLIIADNKVLVDRESATFGDYVDLIGRLSDYSDLWFSVRYVLFGEQKVIRAREFLVAREMGTEDRDKFISEKAGELLWAESVDIAVGNPDKNDDQDIY
jgi:hypothetical protein